MGIPHKSFVEPIDSVPDQAPVELAPSAAPSAVPGITQSPMASLSQTDPSFAQPPPGYMPGPTSYMKMFDDESPSSKFFMALASYGQDMPVSMKLKMAELQANKQLQETKMGWDNFYVGTAKARQVMTQQNRDAMMAGLESMPKLKYQISAIADPVERKAYAQSASTWLNSVSPGLGDHMMKFADNPALGYAMDGLADDPEYGDAFKEVIARVGIPNAYSHKDWLQVANARNHDMMNAIVLNHFNDEDSKKLHSGKMTEEEFRTAHSNASKDALVRGRIQQRDLLGMKLYMSSEEGVAQMAQHGVQTNKAALAHQIKQKSASPQDQAYEERKAILAQPNARTILGEDVYNKLTEDQEIFLGSRNKRNNLEESSPGNPVNLRFSILTGQKYKTVGEIANIKDPAEKAQMQKLAEQAQRESDENRPLAGAHAQDERVADPTGYYDMAHFNKTGRLKPVRGRFSKEQLFSDKTIAKVSEKARDEIKTYNLIEESSKSIFEVARKAYKPVNGITETARAMAETLLIKAAGDPSMLSDPLVIQAKQSFPELNEYLSQREALLGKFARTVSGEVGVLTDQDVGRVRNLFVTRGDAQRTIDAKEKALNKLMALNARFMKEVLGGADPDALRSSKEYQSAKYGILGTPGSVKQETSEAKPQGKGVDGLMADLEAGK